MPGLYVGKDVTSNDRDRLASHAHYAGIRAHERPFATLTARSRVHESAVTSSAETAEICLPLWATDQPK